MIGGIYFFGTGIYWNDKLFQIWCMITFWLWKKMY